MNFPEILIWNANRPIQITITHSYAHYDFVGVVKAIANSIESTLIEYLFIDIQAPKQASICTFITISLSLDMPVWHCIA